MKKLDITNLDLSATFCVAEDEIQTRLLRFDLDCYALTVPWQEDAVFAFQSFHFSMVLNSMTAPISNVAVLKFSCLVNQDKEDDLFEVRVMSEDGVAYSVDCYENVTQLQSLELVDKFGEDAISPVDEWQLEPVLPFDRILLSKYLKVQLAPYLKGDCKGEVLRQLWREIKQSQGTGKSGTTHFLHSEFGPFRADELVCGRLLLSTPAEGMFISETDGFSPGMPDAPL